MIKRQNGVTLLVLVITIIIIIILATITMNMAFGENGLVEKAEMAKNMTEEAGKKEQEQLTNTAAYLNEIIYGEGGGQDQNGEEGGNTEEPSTNEDYTNTVESNEIGGNEVETNTIEPPPVEEIPDGDEEGAIIFGEPIWSKEKASITIETETEYQIEYKINEDEWKKLIISSEGTNKGKVEGLNHNDVVYARLTDGENVGKETSITIQDTTAPKVVATASSIDTSKIKVSVQTSDDESGMAEEITYTYYIKKSGEEESSYVQKESNTTNTYTFTELEQGTSYDIKVEVVGDKAGNKGTGLLAGQTTSTLPGGEESTETGALEFGTPTWKNEKASITVSTNTSYNIEYQINGISGEWKKLNISGEEIRQGKIEDLSHNDTVYVRLTDGTNYGQPAKKTILDEVNPAKATINLSKETAIVGENLTADVTHIDNESGVDITKSRWVFNAIATNIGTEEGSYTGSFSKNGETISIPTSNIGTYYLHVLTVDKAGNKTETISRAVSIEEIKGAINCSTPIWNKEEAEVELNTEEEEYTIEYKINDGSWTKLETGAGNTGTEGRVGGLHHGDTIYARLTNGSQTGEEVSFKIEDKTAPQVVVTASSTDTSKITVNVEANDNESGMAEEITYTYYIKKSSEEESGYVQKGSNTTNTYTFTGLEQGTKYDIKVEVQGDKAGNKGTGLLTSQSTSTLPGGETGVEAGAISFGKVEWSNGQAETSISTNTSYSIEYQINGVEEEKWQSINNGGTVTGLKHNDIVYARLTDGVNVGEYASITIVDTEIPEKAIINLSKTEAIAGETIGATVTHKDNESGVDVGKSKWIFNTIATSIGTEEGSYTETFKRNGETISIETESIGTYYLHVLTVDKAGNKTETISSAVLLQEIKGSISFGNPTWSNGEATAELSTTEVNYTIEYKINDGTWLKLEEREGNTGTKGKIAGLHHGDTITARLTNGEQTGKEVSFKIEDKTAPQVEVSADKIETSKIAINVKASDNESGMAESVTYTYYIKKSSESNYVQKDTHTVNNEENNSTVTDSYTFTGLTQGTSYDIKVEVQGDKAGNKGTGTITNQTTSRLPGGETGEESGAIAFGEVSWTNEKASISISTNTSYQIEYQVNGTNEGNWKKINNGEKVEELSHNDVVYARLTDGSNNGEPASTTVVDTVAPEKASIDLSTTSAIAGQTITALVNHVDNESGVDIGKSKWIFDTIATSIGTEEGSYTSGMSGTFTNNGETISIATSNIGTYYLHILTVDKAGNKTETISEAVVLKKIEGDIEIGAPTWKEGTASITLSTTANGYTIQYKVNSGEWKNLSEAGNGSTGTNGTISGLKHNDKVTVRLTNGSQYGDEAETTIKDSTAPQVVITASNKATSSITVNVKAEDNESGMAESVTYTYYIKKSSESNYAEKDTHTVDNASNNRTVTDSYTFEGLEQGTNYDIKVEVQGDKAGNKGTGTITNQTTSTLPGGETGEESGAIKFGTVTWSNGLAQTSISTNTSYSIEYQVNGPEEENWKTIANNGKVTGINNNSTVYARLTDGVNYGEYASITIKDTIEPAKANIKLNKTEAIAGQTIEATVTHTDNETGVDIGRSKWVFNTTQGDIGTEEGSYTSGTSGIFASNGETIKIPTSSTGTYYLHVLTTDKAGNKTETISEAVTLEKITGAINKEGETTWSNGEASIVVNTEEKDYTIEYKINDGEWVKLEEAPGQDGNTGTRGTIPGLKDGDIVHARLTNGAQYGEEVTFEIQDTTAPQVVVTASSIDTSKITVNVVARDDESGMASTVTYTYYIKKSNDPESAYAKKASNSTNTYTFTELEQGTSYDIKVEVQGDKAGNKGTGLLTNQRTETLPGGEESTENGAISFGSPSWSNGEASIVITTNTNYTIEYQINSTITQGWKTITSGGKVTGLKHNDTVYARLTDGSNYGEPASTVITDEINPTKASINLSKTNAIAGETITAGITHTDNESGVDINKCRWVFNTSSINIGTDEGNYTSGTSGMSGTFTSNGEKISIPTSSIGTYYLHVLTVDRAGNKTETISKAVTLEEIKGNITCGSPTWSSGLARVTLSTTSEYSIQYKINNGSWNSYYSGVTGLYHGDIIHARLTNGAQYGEEVTFEIQDTTAPQVVVTASSADTSKITVNVRASDNESGMSSTVTYTYYIKKSSEYSYQQKTSSSSSSYTYTGLTQGTSYDIKVEVQGDKAGNKGTGTITNQRTETLPGGDESLQNGAIRFGSVSWSGGTAKTSISTNTSYNIEYQINETSSYNWRSISNGGTVTGLNHNDTVYARLTDGVNDGEYASLTIKDTTNPSLSIQTGEVTHESIKIEVSASDSQTGLATSGTYKYYLNNTLKETSTSSTYTYTGLQPETSYAIKVEVMDKAGNTGTQTINLRTGEQPILEAEDISKNPTEYYGAEVKGYECNSDGVSKWRIFYADETNIYLIADDYIAYSNAPLGKNGSALKKMRGEYCLSFDNIINDYIGAQDINNSKAIKWLSKFMERFPTSTNENAKAVAYLMDTNVWSKYAGEKAEYAIGGPTLELFCASYKDTHPDKYIEYSTDNYGGYVMKWNTDSTYSSEQVPGLIKYDYNSIYTKPSSATSATGMWLGAPVYNTTAANGNDAMVYAGGDGYLNIGMTHFCIGPGLRPIVCLNVGIQLEKQSDGTLKIIN